jgi:hypothetical protein
MSASPIASASALSSPSTEAIRQLELAINDAIPAAVRQARAAWRSDLPKLLASHRGQWVAYQGQRQAGIGDTKTELVRQCLAAGSKHGEFVVLLVEPEADHQITVPVDV